MATSLAVATFTCLPVGALTAGAVPRSAWGPLHAMVAGMAKPFAGASPAAHGRGHDVPAPSLSSADATALPSATVTTSGLPSPTSTPLTTDSPLPSPTSTPLISASALPSPTATPISSGDTLPTSVSSSSGVSDAQLLDSIGVNIHPGWLDTTYVQNHTADATLGSLVRLGVKRVRFVLDKQPQPYIAPFLDGLRSNGIRSLAVVGTPTGRWGTYASGESGQLKQAITGGVYQDRLSELEMPNEWDHNGGTDWASQLAGFDSEYFPALSTSSVGLPILGPSMAHTSGYASYSTTRTAEIRNIHPYSGRSLPESSYVLPAWLSASSASSPSSRVAATELGWPNATGAFDGVTESQSAAYLLRSLLWNRTHGVEQNYIYELFDEKPEPAQLNREEHFGLVAVSGDPADRSTWTQREKPAYTELRDLLAHLRDTGSATPSTVGYSLSGEPSDTYSTRLLRADGSMDIAIWRRIPLGTDTYTGRTTATMNFDSPVAASAYDSVTGNTTGLTTSGSSVQVPISGAVTIVRVSAPR